MVRISEIQSAMAHLVGWRQDANPSKRISGRELQTDSGLYYQDAHPLLTLDDIRSSMPDLSGVTYSAYSSTTAYKKGDICTKSNTMFICRKDCTGIDPESTDFNEDYSEDYGNGYWAVYDQLSEFLDEQVGAGIANMVNRFIAEKTIGGESRTLLEHKCFFDGAGRMNNRITNEGMLVGFEIEPVRGLGITIQLHRLGLQMAGGNGIVTMYLFHTSQPTPIATFNVRMLQNNGYQWFNLSDIFLPYMSEHTNAGGQWYLCYYQSALPYGMEAVNINRDWAKDPCQQCHRTNAEVWKEMTKYVRLSPFKAVVGSDFATNPTLPDYDDITYTPTYCYGINAEMSVGCDLTDFIISQKHIFANVLQKEVCYELLKRIAYNPEVNVNRHQMNVSRQDIILELDGNTYTRSGGLRADLKKAYDALSIDTKGMDTACLSCKKVGIKFRGV